MIFFKINNNSVILFILGFVQEVSSINSVAKIDDSSKDKSKQDFKEHVENNNKLGKSS